jgi:hypothetical protein
MIPTRDVSVNVVMRRLQGSPPRGTDSITSSACSRIAVGSSMPIAAIDA